MSSTARSRRRATAVAVPSTVAVLLAGAFAAAPALAATSAPTLPFPSVCPTGQSGAANPGPAASGPAASATPAGSAAASTSASAGRSTAPSAASSASAAPATSAAPAPSASPTPKPTANAPKATASTSTSATPTAAAGTGSGFWGWLNGVWTWIFTDTPQTAAHPAALDAVAPLADAHHVPALAAAAGATPTCVPAAEAASLAAAAAASPSEGMTAGTIPWVMKTPSMTMWTLTYNGVKSVQVWDPSTKKYVDENVLDFTGSELDIQSMVTYSIQNGQTVYNNAGRGTTTKLTNPHLMVVKLTADLYGLLQQTYTPDNPPPLPVGVPIPLLPVVFTNVTSVNAALHTDGIVVPGFNGFASAGVASPQ